MENTKPKIYRITLRITSSERKKIDWAKNKIGVTSICGFFKVAALEKFEAVYKFEKQLQNGNKNKNK